MQEFKINLKKIGVVFVAVAGWLWAGFQYFDSKPSALVGYIGPAGAPINVILDNGAKSQSADPDIGFFRFNNIPRGLHAVRFEQDGYHPLSRNFIVATWGDILLPRNLRLVPMTEPKPLQDDNVIVTLSMMSSPDGADIEDISAVFSNVLPEYFADLGELDSGWVYLGKKVGNDQFQGPFFPAALHSGVDTGAILYSSMPALLRSTKPDAVGRFGLRRYDGYDLGNIIGIVDPGAEVRVVELAERIGDDAIWARVSLNHGIDLPESRQ